MNMDQMRSWKLVQVNPSSQRVERLLGEGMTRSEAEGLASATEGNVRTLRLWTPEGQLIPFVSPELFG